MAIARAHIEQLARPTWFPRIQRSRVIGMLIAAALAGGLIVPAKAADPGTLDSGVDRTTAGRESPGPIPLVAAPVSSRTHVLFGAWVKPSDTQTPEEALAAMESEIGRTYSIYHYYNGWQNPLIDERGQYASSHGSRLLINWKAALEWAGGKSNGAGAGYVRWADIAAGKQDAIIRARARELKAFKKVVYLC